MAEREGFEPSVPLTVHTLSKRAPSTTRPPLLTKFETKKIFAYTCIDNYSIFYNTNIKYNEK
jgi:hypothetical protein